MNPKYRMQRKERILTTVLLGTDLVVSTYYGALGYDSRSVGAFDCPHLYGHSDLAFPLKGFLN